jgi:hypothetical protein
MFGETENQYIGKILKKLSAGKTLKHLLLEADWTERAHMLSKLKQIRKAHEAFLEIVAE